MSLPLLRGSCWIFIALGINTEMLSAARKCPGILCLLLQPGASLPLAPHHNHVFSFFSSLQAPFPSHSEPSRRLFLLFEIVSPLASLDLFNYYSNVTVLGKQAFARIFRHIHISHSMHLYYHTFHRPYSYNYLCIWLMRARTTSTLHAMASHGLCRDFITIGQIKLMNAI